MREEAVFLWAGPPRLYAYGALLAAGALAAGLLLLSGKKEARLRDASVLLCVLGLPLGLVFSRLFYCLGDAAFRELITLKNILDISAGGLSMYGAFTGILLAALAAAALTGAGRAELLDRLAPALTALVFFARLAEGFTSLGISRPLLPGSLPEGFIVFQDAYDAYLKTFLLEAAAAALLLFFLLRMKRRGKRRPGDVFVAWMLLYGASQTLFESLRYDSHMRLGFVGIQHILSALMMSAAVLILALRQRRSQPLLARFSAGILLPLAGALVWLEFLIDRSSVSRFLLYTVYVALLGLPVVLGLALGKDRRQSPGT